MKRRRKNPIKRSGWSGGNSLIQVIIRLVPDAIWRDQRFSE